MSWKERTVCKILLMVARIVAHPSFTTEIKELSDHIAKGAPTD